MPTLNSEEITLCCDSVSSGVVYLPSVSVSLHMHWYFLYIFLLVDCFEWALIYVTEQQKVHSVLWQFRMGGPSAFGVCIFIYALVFPYIFLLVDCFEWALIYVIEQQKVSLCPLAVSNGGEGLSEHFVCQI